MTPSFKAGDTAYIVANGMEVLEVKIVAISGGFYTTRLPSGGGIRLRESRLFPTKEAAEATTPKKHQSPW